jgi:hypothetical protein
MRLSAFLCTANIAEVADGGWAVIASYGEHPSPDGRYVQHFDRPQAEAVVQTWNSIPGTAVRWFKNLAHGLGLKYSAPVWDGHPDDGGARCSKEKLLAEITDLRTGNDGLEGRVKWNTAGTAARPRGPLFPSALWWHWPPSGEPPTVYPEVLESVGLVRTPNISGVPAWTQNASALPSPVKCGGCGKDFDYCARPEVAMGAVACPHCGARVDQNGNPLAGNPQAENQTQNNMNKEQLEALRRALGLTDAADPNACIQAAIAANAALANLTTANSAKAEAEKTLSTANATIEQLNRERDDIKAKHGVLTTENSALKTANATLVKGVLDVAEKRGVITPAERGGFETRITTANTAADALKELETRKPALNVTAIELNGNRMDISTANARQTAFDAAVAKRIKDDNCDRDTAFARCLADPALKALTDAMADPTKKSP